MSKLTAWDVLLAPRLTEKSTRLREEAARWTKVGPSFVFEVHPRANKIQIKAAVETIFEVQVAHVRTVNVAPKKRRYGRFQGERPTQKKAYVTLKQGSKTIDFLEG